MAAIKLLFVSSLLLIADLQEIRGHGMLMDPVNRSSAWRKGFETPDNYNDNELFCGGIGVQFNRQNNGRCGVCGDAFHLRRPRSNENGGTYGTGKIVKTYRPGQRFTATVHVSANHLGYFKFAVCPLSRPGQLETEGCFDRYPVRLANGADHFVLRGGVSGDVNIDLVLPRGLTCKHCVFRWNWRTANSWGVCENGREVMGCGPQEHYRSCSDISIA